MGRNGDSLICGVFLTFRQINPAGQAGVDPSVETAKLGTVYDSLPMTV